MIILLIYEFRDNQGLLKVGDVFSEDFIKYELLNKIIEDKNISIILFENLLFVDIFLNKEGGVKFISMLFLFIRE